MDWVCPNGKKCKSYWDRRACFSPEIMSLSHITNPAGGPEAGVPPHWAGVTLLNYHCSIIMWKNLRSPPHCGYTAMSQKCNISSVWMGPEWVNQSTLTNMFQTVKQLSLLAEREREPLFFSCVVELAICTAISWFHISIVLLSILSCFRSLMNMTMGKKDTDRRSPRNTHNPFFRAIHLKKLINRTRRFTDFSNDFFVCYS